MKITFRVDIKDWTKISIENVSQYLELAEKRLEETVETANIITNRNDKLLAINISIISIVLGYVTNSITNVLKLQLPTTAFISIIILLFALFYLVQNLFQYKIGTKGEEPKAIFTSEYINENYTNEETYKAVALQICEAYQTKIDNNRQVNNSRSSRLQKAIYSMVFLPLSFIISWFFLSVF